MLLLINDFSPFCTSQGLLYGRTDTWRFACDVLFLSTIITGRFTASLYSLSLHQSESDQFCDSSDRESLNVSVVFLCVVQSFLFVLFIT
jgi:hypothetical protein